jgi:hypothetical protein
VFLESAIENLNETQLILQSWSEFKKTIFDIIDHRIEFAAEINGAINTSYMSLDEHLIVFWTNSFMLSGLSFGKSKDMTGTKADIQFRIIEFLYSLKYYSFRWLRAR